MADRLSQMKLEHKAKILAENWDVAWSSQFLYVEVDDRGLYSTLVKDLKIVCCFLDDHEMGFEPKNTTKPVDLLSLGSPAQSAWLKALNNKSPLV